MYNTCMHRETSWQPCTDLSAALASYGFSVLAVSRAFFRVSAFILFLSIRALWLRGRVEIKVEKSFIAMLEKKTF